MLILMFAAAAAAPTDGKASALGDWQTLAIYGVGRQEGGAGPIYLQVHAGDLDGDGRPDDAVVKLVCERGKMVESAIRYEHSIRTPRDVASGQASGRRHHAPVTFVKEWGAATPQLMALKASYDLKQLKGNERAVTTDGWQMLSLNNANGLCDAAERAAGTVVKSKSNITNNRVERG